MEQTVISEKLSLATRAGARAIINSPKFNHGNSYCYDVFGDTKSIPYLEAAHILRMNAEQPIIIWVDAEQKTPADIRTRVLIYPIDGNVEVAEYIGEGEYKMWDYKVCGEDITHWAYLHPPK